MAKVLPFAPKSPPEHNVRTLKNKVVVARKTHTLTGCGCVVQPGTKYISMAIILDGRWVYEKHHLYGCMERMC